MPHESTINAERSRAKRRTFRAVSPNVLLSALPSRCRKSCHVFINKVKKRAKRRMNGREARKRKGNTSASAIIPFTRYITRPKRRPKITIVVRFPAALSCR